MVLEWGWGGADNTAHKSQQEGKENDSRGVVGSRGRLPVDQPGGDLEEGLSGGVGVCHLPPPFLPQR